MESSVAEWWESWMFSNAVILLGHVVLFLFFYSGSWSYFIIITISISLFSTRNGPNIKKKFNNPWLRWYLKQIEPFSVMSNILRTEWIISL